MKNKMTNLRDHMFETLEDLRDKEKPMDIERAKAIAQVGSVIVDAAKVQVKFMEITGSQGGNDFFDTQAKRLPGPGDRK